MVEIIFTKICAYSREIKKEFILSEGFNLFQSQRTSRGKTTLISIFDYCFNGKDVFPWFGVYEKYETIALELKYNDTYYHITRGLKKGDTKVKIFKNRISNFMKEVDLVDEDLSIFFTKLLGIKFSQRFSGGKLIKISIRDYLKLFFFRQLDNKNFVGNPFEFNSVKKAGKIALGLEEKSILQESKKEIESKINSKKNYIDKIKSDFGSDLDDISKGKLNNLKEKLNEINKIIDSFENKLNSINDFKNPINKDITIIEHKIKEKNETLFYIREKLIDIQLLKNDLKLDLDSIKKIDISLNVLSKFPDKKCPDCKTEIEDEDQKVFCKLCGTSIEEKHQLITNFYIINKNTEKEILLDEKNLVKQKEVIEDELKNFQQEYDIKIKELAKIETSSILRFTKKVKEHMGERDSIIKEIQEISIKLSYKEIFNKHYTELKKLEEELKEVSNILDSLKETETLFEEHKKLVVKYLKLINTVYKDISWRKEDIFPLIDGKDMLANHGGSNYVRILMSVLSSLFEMSIKYDSIKFPSVLIIDSLRKHEIELEDLKDITNEWINLIKNFKKGQIIISGVEIPENLIEISKKEGKYYFFKENEYTL